MQPSSTFIHRNFTHDCANTQESRFGSKVFQDRKPTEKPILCRDGKFRYPSFTLPGMEFDPTTQPESIKAYGAFCP